MTGAARMQAVMAEAEALQRAWDRLTPEQRRAREEQVEAECLRARTRRPAHEPRPPRMPRRRDLGAPPEHTHHYARLSSAVHEDIRLNGTARQVVAYVVRMARGRATVDLFVEQIADALGVSVRTTQRAQGLASRHGYLRIERRRQGRRNQANRYTPLGPCFPAARPKPLEGTAPAPSALSGDNFVTPRVRQVPLTPLPPFPEGGDRGDRRVAGRDASARCNRARGRPSPGPPASAAPRCSQAASATAVPTPAPAATDQTDLEDWLTEHPPQPPP